MNQPPDAPSFVILNVSERELRCYVRLPTNNAITSWFRLVQGSIPWVAVLGMHDRASELNRMHANTCHASPAAVTLSPAVCGRRHESKPSGDGESREGG